MTGSIVDISSVASPQHMTTDICIIGSGSGGATAAWDLAKTGRQVLVLEEGGDYTGLQLTQRDGQMYDQLYMERAGRMTSDLGVTILQGRVLGGGGVINAADVVPLHDGVLELWRKKFGLTEFSPEQLAPWRARALEDLSANVPRDDQVNLNNRLLKKGTEALGWRGEVMMHNRVGCAGVGTCLIGCPLNAKRNPRFVAIPRALEAGAQFLTRARAVRIEDAGEEMKTVHVRQLDARGYREQKPFTVRARYVILAANAVASTQLLLRSGLGNTHVGRHVSLQPQFPVTAFFDEEVRFFRGIPQTWAVTQFESLHDETHGWWGFRLESIAGTPGIVASLLPLAGAEAKEMMTKYSHLAACLCLLPDEPVGTVEAFENGRVKVHYTFTDELQLRARQAATAAARAYLAAGAKRVIVPSLPPIILESEKDLPKIDTLTIRPASLPVISAHQQGGVRFAPSASEGAANPDGEVYGTKHVYVFDSSGYPTSSSSHTMTPIITTSHFLSEKLKARL